MFNNFFYMYKDCVSAIKIYCDIIIIINNNKFFLDTLYITLKLLHGKNIAFN